MAQASPDRLRFLGTGTSYGIPMVGCQCDVCLSDDPKNKRLRSSVMFEVDDRRILIDTTPDLRQQLLRSGISDVDGIVITHVHADHVFGMDDLRPISLRRSEALPVVALPEAAALLRTTFPYIFAQKSRREGLPWMDLIEVEPGETFSIAGVEFTAFVAEHGRGRTMGVRHRNAAYLTDAKVLAPDDRAILRGVELLVLDMLREEWHPTHLNLADALEITEDAGNPRTYFIHMSHEVDHATLSARLPSHTTLAYDELVIDLPQPPL